MERVLKELKKAQSTFKQTKRDELEGEDEEEEEPEPEIEKVRPPEPRQQKEMDAAPPPKSSKDSFAFRGTFGERQDVTAITP
jgi:Sec-independent protein translocase protein TatA